MASCNDKTIRQKNGEIVMNALLAMNEPTLTNIIKFISETQQIEPNKIKEPIKKVLNIGIEYGFIKKQGRRYSVDAQDDDEEDDEEVDSSSRRRRRRSSGNRKSRSRSRRRRSSRRGRR